MERLGADEGYAGSSVGAGRRACPPHGPILSEPGEGRGRVLRCLGCGTLASRPEEFGLTGAAPRGPEDADDLF